MNLNELIRKAFDGDADSQYQLAGKYKTGDGVVKDEKAALELFKMAASQGHKEAEYAYNNYSINIEYASMEVKENAKVEPKRGSPFIINDSHEKYLETLIQGNLEETIGDGQDSSIIVSSGKASPVNTLENIILLPFRLVWNIIVTGFIIGGFVLWFGFIFGSVVAVILILIFAPDLFLLPLVLVPMYTEIWPED